MALEWHVQRRRRLVQSSRAYRSSSVRKAASQASRRCSRLAAVSSSGEWDSMGLSWLVECPRQRTNAVRYASDRAIQERSGQVQMVLMGPEGPEA